MNLKLSHRATSQATVLMLCTGIVLSGAQTLGSRARLERLSNVQARAAADKIVNNSPGTPATPDDGNGQNFVLRAAGAEDLIILPGELSVKTDGKSLSTIEMQCGIFTLDNKGQARYVSVIGPDYKPYSWCEQLNALGTADDAGPRPRLIAEFYVRALSGDHYNYSFVLAWNPTASAYQVDRKASDWLVQQRGSETIAGARRALSRYRP